MSRRWSTPEAGVDLPRTVARRPGSAPGRKLAFGPSVDDVARTERSARCQPRVMACIPLQSWRVEGSGLDLRSLLAALEDASPVDAVDVLAAELARAVDAGHVALLIASLSGNALVRISHATGSGPQHAGRNERAEKVPLAGTAHERALSRSSPTATVPWSWCRSPNEATPSACSRYR